MNKSSEFRFHENHLWCRPQGNGRVVIGMSAYAQEHLGEIMYFDLPMPERTLATGESFGSVESIKVVNDLIAPLSGEVVEINAAIEEDPTLANTDPYGDGWLLIVLADSDQCGQLMDEEAYERYLHGQG